MGLRLVVASVPDRKHVVVELWDGELHIAEVSKEADDVEIETYETNRPLPAREYLNALGKAIDELDPDD